MSRAEVLTFVWVFSFSFWFAAGMVLVVSHMTGTQAAIALVIGLTLLLWLIARAGDDVRDGEDGL